MGKHKTLPQTELHEPKGIAPLIGGAGDVGKVVVAKGDGTSEVRKLDYSEIDNAPVAQALSGVYFDDNMASAIVEVAVELKLSYLIGAAPTQVVQVKLPDPAVFAGAVLILKRLDTNEGDGSAVKFIPFNTETIEGASELGIKLQNTAVAIGSDGTNWNIVGDIYPKKLKYGWFDYNDLATVGTPLNASAAVPLALTNDEAGANTRKDHAPQDVTDVWNAVGGVFDWSQLELGDTVDIRLDVTVTTTAVNQNVDLYLQLGQGGFSYNIIFDTILVKAASTKQLVSFSSVYMGDANTLANAAQFFILTDASATVTVNGWYCRVIGSKDTY